MRIATVVLTHGLPAVTCDTVESIQTWVGDRVLVLVDQAGWPIFQNVRFGNALIEPGFLHACNRSPYRNAALGLKKLFEYWPDSDWFLYTEYDCLYLSDVFKSDLATAQTLDAWCVGVDLRRFDFQMPTLETLLNCGRIQHSYFFEGSCQFYSRNFLIRMQQINFIDRLLEFTKGFPNGDFPGYRRWAFEEELWPTVAVHLGGGLYELSCFKGPDRCWQGRIEGNPQLLYAPGEHLHWRGHYRRYPIRFSPGITTSDIYPSTCIAHPIKDLYDIIRIQSRNKRLSIQAK